MEQFLLLALVLGASKEQAARKPAVEAYYKYTGAEEIVHQVEKKVPKDLQFFVGNVGFVTNVIAEKKLTLTFHF
jgi:hypothetical protein